MKLIFVTLLLALCSVDSSRADQIDGAWVLSEKWTGYMGIALVIHGDQFKYWFYSDVRLSDEPHYPIEGKVLYQGDTLRLQPSQEAHLYDTEWHLVIWKGEICLLAEKHYKKFQEDKKLPDDRLLFKMQNFDEKNPTENRPGKR